MRVVHLDRYMRSVLTKNLVFRRLGLAAPDLPPVPGKYPTLGRDYEYIRHGTVSIMAGIDLHTGHIFAQVQDRHRSREFIALLQSSDAYYPPQAIIRLILDNHSSHISKETRAYLATRPGRFEYIHTPNMVPGLI